MTPTINTTFRDVCNDEIQISTLTRDDLNGALDVISKSFLVRENVVIGSETNLIESERSRQDLLELCREVFNDGVSIIAKHVESGKVVAVAFNKIQVAGKPGDKPYFADFIERHGCAPNSTSLMEFMIEVDAAYDLFENLKINCLLEIMFFATLPEFCNRKIAQAVCRNSIELAKGLSEGKGLEHFRHDIRNIRVQAISAIFTSSISQRVGKAVGFKTFAEVPYTTFIFNGKTYADRIGPQDPVTKLVAIKF